MCYNQTSEFKSFRRRNEEKAFSHTESDYYSDLMLEAMQTSAIFFNGNGIIYRINTLASKDFHLTASPVGHKFSEFISVIYNNENIFTELIADFEAPGTAQVKLPGKTIVRCNDTKVQFFVTGCITRLNKGSYLFSFRNTMDEITREHILSMVLARTKIFPWFYDMDQNKMLTMLIGFLIWGFRRRLYHDPGRIFCPCTSRRT